MDRSRQLERGVRFESAKVVTGRTWWVTVGLLFIAQPFLSYVSALQLAETGVDATMESDPGLIAPLPPVEYFGFDVVLIGQLVIVALGALIGAADHVSGEFRTTLLAVNGRSQVMVAKLLSFVVLATVIAGVSSYLTIAMQHLGLAGQGLDVGRLSPLVWSLLFRATVAHVSLGLISYCLALMLRSRVVALVVMVPQIVGPGTLLADIWAPAHYLPGAVAGRLFASPVDASPVSVPAAAVALSIWVLVAIAAAWIVVCRRDVGAR